MKTVSFTVLDSKELDKILSIFKNFKIKDIKTHENTTPELTQQDFIALEQSKKEDEKGLYTPSEEVHKEAIKLCTK